MAMKKFHMNRLSCEKLTITNNDLKAWTRLGLWRKAGVHEGTRHTGTRQRENLKTRVGNGEQLDTIRNEGRRSDR